MSQRGSTKPKKNSKDDTKPPSTANLPVVIPSANNSELLELDPNEGRRKRQKNLSPKDKDSEIREDVQPPSPEASTEAPLQKASSSNDSQPEFESPIRKDTENEGLNRLSQPRSVPSPENSISMPSEIEENGMHKGTASPDRGNVSSTLSASSVIQESLRNIEYPVNETPDQRPKKVLHFNPKTGTIGSPPAKKTTVLSNHAKARSSSQAKKPKIKLVIIHYGHGKTSTAAIGLQIHQILTGTRLISPVLTEKSPATENQLLTSTSKSAKPITTVAAKHPTALHPFFFGKSLAKPQNATQTENVTVEVPEQMGSESLDQPRTETGNRPPIPSRLKTSAFTGVQGFGNSTKTRQVPRCY